jgi:heme-degrading monooxygenase HmoA
MAELGAAYSEFISLQPGFVGAALHVNDARTRVANYSQWRNRDDFKAMLKTEEMQRAKPADQRALPRVRAGDVRGVRDP